MIDQPSPPPDSMPSVRLALASLQTNDLDAAEAHCRQALASRPGDIPALTVLGGILHMLARHGEAEAVFEDLTHLAPNDPTHWMNLGTARRGAAKFDTALAAYMRAADLGGKSADFYFNVGLTHLDRLDYESARAVLARAMELAPDDAEIRFEYVRACNESNHTDEAVAALEGWKGMQALAPDLAGKLGQQYLALGKTQSAEDAVRQFALPASLEPRAALTLVQIFERTNRVAEARSLLKLVQADPRARALAGELQLAEAQLAQRESRHEEASRLFTKLIRSNPDFHKRHFELFPLAKSQDALGQHDQAFETLNEAHRSQVAHIKLIAPLVAMRGPPALIITQFGCDPADIADWDESDAPPTEASPVFVLGFPRSGTTLLELTLDAHPELKSMDEQPFLQDAIDDLFAAGLRYPEQLSHATPAVLDAVRAKYWARALGKVTLAPGQRLVDKNPLNVLRLPAIRRLFPNARIVLAIRHPCDVLLSCYMQHFTVPEFALLCADLPTLAMGYRKSFDFWFQQDALLQPAVHEVRYETFVADFDREVRRVSDFLGLPWHDAMLAPAQHARAKGFISTPSYSQVVQPVNSNSVGRWKPYEKYFAAVSPLLEPYLARWGYEAATPA